MTEPARKKSATRRAVDDARELEELAEQEADGTVDGPPMARSTSAAASEVFSVRLPNDAAAALQAAAAEQGISPGVLLRSIALRELTGDSCQGALTYKQAEELFRETLARAATQTLGKVSGPADTKARGVNLGPARVHQKLKHR